MQPAPHVCILGLPGTPESEETRQSAQANGLGLDMLTPAQFLSNPALVPVHQHTLPIILQKGYSEEEIAAVHTFCLHRGMNLLPIGDKALWEDLIPLELPELELIQPISRDDNWERLCLPEEVCRTVENAVESVPDTCSINGTAVSLVPCTLDNPLADLNVPRTKTASADTAAAPQGLRKSTLIIFISTLLLSSTGILLFVLPHLKPVENMPVGNEAPAPLPALEPGPQSEGAEQDSTDAGSLHNSEIRSAEETAEKYARTAKEQLDETLKLAVLARRLKKHNDIKEALLKAQAAKEAALQAEHAAKQAGTEAAMKSAMLAQMYAKKAHYVAKSSSLEAHTCPPATELQKAIASGTIHQDLREGASYGCEQCRMQLRSTAELVTEHWANIAHDLLQKTLYHVQAFRKSQLRHERIQANHAAHKAQNAADQAMRAAAVAGTETAMKMAARARMHATQAAFYIQNTSVSHQHPAKNVLLESPVSDSVSPHMMAGAPSYCASGMEKSPYSD